MPLWGARAFLCAMLFHAGVACDGASAWQPPAGAQPLTIMYEAPNGFPQWHYPYSGAYDALRLVIRDSASWSTFWTQYISKVDPVAPIDFESETVIAAGMGWRPTGGYHVEIPSVYALQFQVFVVVCEISPPRDGGGNTAAETQPLTLVRIPRMDDTYVTFVEQPAVGACPAQLN